MFPAERLTRRGTGVSAAPVVRSLVPTRNDKDSSDKRGSLGTFHRIRRVLDPATQAGASTYFLTMTVTPIRVRWVPKRVKQRIRSVGGVPEPGGPQILVHNGGRGGHEGHDPRFPALAR